ncbi:MAG: hypothetical protein LBT46_12755 [Planctomycetaceae bacterium]|jgi:hypothetical protein|nr:hypothetical protein [Planctomycetaceae bacterium]
MNWYYYDNNGTKSRLISQQELENLVAREVIIRTTRLETESGHKGLAGQVPGLSFPSVPVPPMPVLPSSPLLDNIRSAFMGWRISGAAFFALMILGMLLVLVAPEDDTEPLSGGEAVAAFIVIPLFFLGLNSPRLFFGWKLYHRLADTVDVSVRPDSRVTWYNFRSLNVINQLAESINKTLILRGRPDKVISSNYFCRGAFYCEMICWLTFFSLMRMEIMATSRGTASATSASAVVAVEFFVMVIIIVCFVLETMYFRSCVQGAEQILNDQ